MPFNEQRLLFELTLETALTCWALMVADFSSNALAFASSARLFTNSSVRSSIWKNGRWAHVSWTNKHQSYQLRHNSVSPAKLPTIASDAGLTFMLLFIFVLIVDFNLGALFSMLTNVQHETRSHPKVCVPFPISRFTYFRWFFFVPRTMSLVSIPPPGVI